MRFFYRSLPTMFMLFLGSVAWAQDFNFEGGDRSFVAPGNLFAVQMPPGWVALSDPQDPSTIQFQASGKPGDGHLFVRKFPVPDGAKRRQLIAVALDERLKKLPLVKIESRRDVKVAGNLGAAVVISYKYQGNIEYGRIGEELAAVFGTEAYLFHFECEEAGASSLANDLESFYRSFVPHPSGFSSEGITEQVIPPISF